MEDNPDDVISVISVDPWPSNYFPPTVWKWKHLLRPPACARSGWSLRSFSTVMGESLDPEPSWTYLWISRLLLWHRPPTVLHPKAQQRMFHPEAADRSTRSLIEPVFVSNTAPCNCLTEKSSKTNQNHQTCSWDHRHQLSELLQRCSLRHTPTASESVWPKKSRTDKNSFIPLFNVALHTCGFNFYERLVFSSRVVRAPTKGSYLSPCDRQ